MSFLAYIPVLAGVCLLGMFLYAIATQPKPEAIYVHDSVVLPFQSDLNQRVPR